MFSNKKLRTAEASLLEAQATIAAQLTELAAARKIISDQDNNAKQLETEIADLNVQLTENFKNQSTLTARYAGIVDIETRVANQKEEYDQLMTQYTAAHSIFQELEKEVALYQDHLEINSFGLYTPQFDFETVDEFKEALLANYENQKQLVKDDKAIICQTEWSVGGSKTEGKKMTNQYKKLMLLAFNGECESLIARVKWNNAEKTRERISKAFEAVNKLGASHQIHITPEFLSLKQVELSLTYEQELKKYEEKEEQRRIREQMREEEKAQREFERAQREAEDEENRYERALQKAQDELSGAAGPELSLLQDKVRLLEQQLAEAHAKKERAIALAQLTKVGHIYVISNIGSFGEGVYKMGMTRRLDPLDRIRELGDASVPFQFDVHAIIYSENAPQLENELHRQFRDHRLNRINGKKEFFRVSLDEIESFVAGHTGASISFTKAAEAREYRETVTLMGQLQEQLTAQIIEKFPKTLTA